MKKLILGLFLILPFLNFAQSNKNLELLSAILKHDDAKSMSQFITAGNDVNECYAVKESSYSPLVMSIKFGSKNVFDECLKSGADLNQICADKTPLMYAIKYEEIDFFHALLKAGADVQKTSKKGKTAADYAKKYGQEGLLEYLK